MRGEVLARTASGAFAEDPERLVRDGLAAVRGRRLQRRNAGLSALLAAPGERDQASLRDLLAEQMHIDEELQKLKRVSGDDRSSG